MSDLETLKQAFKQMNLYFEIQITLFGFALIAKTEITEVTFEFDQKGKFYKNSVSV